MAKIENLAEKISSAIEKGRKLKEKQTVKEKKHDKKGDAAMAADLAGMEEKIRSAIGKVKDLKNEKAAAETKAEELEKKLSEKDASIEELQGKLKQELEGGLQEKEKVIEDLKSRLTSVDSQVESLLKEVLGGQ